MDKQDAEVVAETGTSKDFACPLDGEAPRAYAATGSPTVGRIAYLPCDDRLFFRPAEQYHAEG